MSFRAQEREPIPYREREAASAHLLTLGHIERQFRHRLRQRARQPRQRWQFLRDDDAFSQTPIAPYAKLRGASVSCGNAPLSSFLARLNEFVEVGDLRRCSEGAFLPGEHDAFLHPIGDVVFDRTMTFPRRGLLSLTQSASSGGCHVVLAASSHHLPFRRSKMSGSVCGDSDACAN